MPMTSQATAYLAFPKIAQLKTSLKRNDFCLKLKFVLKCYLFHSRQTSTKAQLKLFLNEKKYMTKNMESHADVAQV